MCGGSSGGSSYVPPPTPVIETKVATNAGYEAWKDVRSDERQRRIAMLSEQDLIPDPFRTTQDPSSDKTRTTLLGS